MNKIKIDNDNIIIDNNDEYFWDITKDSKVNIEVNKNISSKLVIINNEHDVDLEINLYSNAHLIINSLNKNANYNIRINLLEENSDITYNHSMISSVGAITNYKINHLANNTNSLINNNGVNLENNKLYFNVDGIVNRDSKMVNINQKNRIINIKNGDSKIIPNFIIDNNDISANHSAYIGNFSEDDKYYIKSRGISEEEMYKLLYRSLLLGNMNLSSEEELFNNKLKEWRLL